VFAVLEPSRPLGKPRFLDTVRESLWARHYSRRTEEAYVAWIRRYIIFSGKRHSTQIGGPGGDDVPDVARRGAACGRVHAEPGAAAMLFLYRSVLGIDLPWLDELVRARGGLNGFPSS
jgi:hypothetical protein